VSNGAHPVGVDPFCSAPPSTVRQWILILPRSCSEPPFTESGKKIYRTEIVVGDISLLSDGGHSGKAAPDRRVPNDSRPDEPTGDFDGLGISDSEIPF
jgi:hypothetical protein